MNSLLPKALFEAPLSHDITTSKIVQKGDADLLFHFFQHNPLFRWGDAQNDCEDRANALCLLLDSWGVPNYKSWVFSGGFLKKTTGSLINCWNYHVAAALPVSEGDHTTLYIVDPATAASPISLNDWANRLTKEACSYYLIRKNEDYIFHQKTIGYDNWYKRDKQNFKWTIQGLAGINGVSAKGKAQLVFNKKRIKNAEHAFKKLLKNKPL